MKILVTGSKGFLGKNLVSNLYNIKNGFDKTRPNIKIDEIYEYDIDKTLDDLDNYTKDADFIFHLAGINRADNPQDFIKGNVEFTNTLINLLKKNNNHSDIMFSSSMQATLIGRYNNDYGKSKLEAEELLFKFQKDFGSKVHVFRFPNLIGKWIRPNYNSAVATFCYNIARDIEIHVNDRSTELELLFIDDLIDSMLDLIEGIEHKCNFDKIDKVFDRDLKYNYVQITYKRTLGEIVDWLYLFNSNINAIKVPSIPDGSFEKKLYSMYLSYLPKEKMKIDLKMNIDNRGSFTELIKTESNGQFSVNIIKPNITKGEHYHNLKWEYFICVKGRCLIEERKIDSDEILSFDVSGEKIEAIYMIPGYTHNITNLSERDDAVVIMWANEEFNKDKPDTFSLKVRK